MEYTWFFKGLVVSASLIAAIGSQNAFVLKQGLLRNHIVWVVVICCLCDAILMSAGVWGIGGLIGMNPVLAGVLSIAGAVFLLVYGAGSFQRAWRGGENLIAEGEVLPARGKTILATLAVTLLNPHVYLDTVMIVGGVAVGLTPSEKQFFLLGAVVASILWFSTIGFGAKLLLPIFRRPLAWRILECLIGCMMWWIALGLLRDVWHLIARTAA